jgi:hypothetical protein
VLHTEEFVVANTSPPESVSGDTILVAMHYHHNVNPWGILIVLLGYVVAFRVIQYALLAWQTGTLPFSTPATGGAAAIRRNSSICHADRACPSPSAAGAAVSPHLVPGVLPDAVPMVKTDPEPTAVALQSVENDEMKDTKNLNLA